MAQEVRIGSTDHRYDRFQLRTLCGIVIAGTPVSPRSTGPCLECELAAQAEQDALVEQYAAELGEAATPDAVAELVHRERVRLGHEAATADDYDIALGDPSTYA